MLFSAPIFLFAFLPLCLMCYFAARSLSMRNAVILVFSGIFFMWGDLWFFLMILCGTFFDYLLIKYVMNNPRYEGKIRRTTVLSIAVIINVLLLVFFKYGNFLVDQVNPLLLFLEWEKPSWYGVALPLGISFVTFHRISLLVDCYRDVRVTPTSYWDTLLYIIVFPHMIAGPIVRYSEISRFFYARPHYHRRFVVGALIFGIGLAKKILLADPLGTIADFGFDGNYQTLPSAILWLSVFAYTLQIYFDFSGYSDMAIGLARMFGIRFPQNFNAPYTATSVTDFWRRWHITLSKWMGRYLYVPLGGNRVSALRNFSNLWIVFIISGFWHGASWNFLLWGCYHGFFISLDKVTKKIGFISSMHWSVKQAVTFFIVLNSWVLFRAQDLSQAVYIYRRIYMDFGRPYADPFWLDFTPYQMTILLFASTLALLPLRRISRFRAFGVWVLRHTSLSLLIALSSIFICSAFVFSSTTETFLYFRF